MEYHKGSILGPLLFLIFINDLPLFIREHVFSTYLYADDTIFYDVQKDIPTIKTNLQRALDCLKEWCRQNGMILNTEKTKIMLLSTRQKRLHIDESILSLTYDNIDLQITTGDKILGINIDQNLQWNNHFHAVCKKVSSYIWLLSRILSYLSTEYRLLFYKAYIVPHLNYCNIIWGNSSNYNVSRITKLQKRACKIILGNGYTDFEDAKSVLNVLSFEESLFLNKAKIMYKIAKNIIPPYICDLFHRRSDSIMNTTLRSVSDENFVTPRPNLSIFKENLSYSGPVIWNSIPLEIKNSSSLKCFAENVLQWMNRS